METLTYKILGVLVLLGLIISYVVKKIRARERENRQRVAIMGAPLHVRERFDKIDRLIWRWPNVPDSVKIFFLKQVRGGPYTDKLLALGQGEPYPAHDFEAYCDKEGLWMFDLEIKSNGRALCLTNPGERRETPR